MNKNMREIRTYTHLRAKMGKEQIQRWEQIEKKICSSNLVLSNAFWLARLTSFFKETNNAS